MTTENGSKYITNRTVVGLLVGILVLLVSAFLADARSDIDNLQGNYMIQQEMIIRIDAKLDYLIEIVEAQ